jgi:hypothetical protein
VTHMTSTRNATYSHHYAVSIRRNAQRYYKEERTQAATST